MAAHPNMSALAPRMSTQHALALPSPAPSNTVVINARCSLRIEADQRVIVVAGLPVHHYRAEDVVAEAYAIVFLVESSFAQQTDVARAFGRSVRTIRRFQKRMHTAGWPRLVRGRVASRPTAYLREASAQRRDPEEPGDEQPCDRASTWRQRDGHSQAGRTFEARRERTTCVARNPDRREKPTRTGVPFATLSSEDGDRATRSAEERRGRSIRSPRPRLRTTMSRCR